MKKIHRVIYQEIIPPALIALGVLTFVVFTREFGRLAELLIRKVADGFTVFQVVLSLMPAILIFTVPISFLVGTLVGFSRLSTESEVVAMRAGGIGVLQIMRPVLKLALLATAIGFILNFVLLPEGNWKLRRLKQEIGMRPVQSQVRPRVFNEDLPGKLLYVEDVDLRSQLWRGVFLADTRDDGTRRIILAKNGQVLFAPDNSRLQLYFSDGSVYEFNEKEPQKYGLSHFGTLDVSVDLPEAEPIAQQAKRDSDKSMRELWREAGSLNTEVSRRAWVEIQRRTALPLSSLIFAVLGVTLGISTHRGGRGYGSIVGMTVAFTYYVLFVTGSELASEGVVHPIVGVWGANLLFALLAFGALNEARRGMTLLSAFSNVRPVARVIAGLRGVTGWVSRHSGRITGTIRRWLWGLSGIRLRLARVVDLYLLRLYGFNLISTLLVCTALFYLFTFFELVDELFEYGVGWSVLAEYFLYLLPQVLTLLIPISVLIATLVTFGLLEKTFQLVALKASGISLYRVVLPVLALAAVVSLGIFIIQEQLLPYANQRQDNLRDIIKGRPVQTHYQPGSNWIFGQDNILYNYNYFDADRGLFAELSVYRLDISENQLWSHTYVRRAVWLPATQDWLLGPGWRKSFETSEEGFSEFESIESARLEQPDYFAQEVKESSKMTFAELQAYISELRNAGFEVEHLQTDLHKKLSFPVVNIIMVLLGIPFALSVGRKGALYGVAAGTLLGIIYWGAFGVFTVLGGNGLLMPELAAWGPNLLVGSASLFLLLSVQT